jgi:hypothetical protein
MNLRFQRNAIIETIQELGFGIIERLSIRDGQPCFDSAPRIVQSNKLLILARSCEEGD